MTKSHSDDGGKNQTDRQVQQGMRDATTTKVKNDDGTKSDVKGGTPGRQL